MRIKYTRIEDKVTDKLEALLNRAAHPEGFINRVIYPMYQQAQIERWNTENQSEGKPWKPLNPNYKKAKRKIYASYPYGGSKMLIATGTLLKSVVGTAAAFHRKVVTTDGMIIMTTVPYAQDVANVRPFMDFDQDGRTVRSMKKALKQWVANG